MVLAALLAGCHGGPQTDIYERELRWQEDQIYALKSYLDQYHDELRQTRRENARLRHRLQGAPVVTPSQSPIVPEVEPGAEEEVIPLVPEVELGEPGASRGGFQTPDQSRDHELGEVQLAYWQRPASETTVSDVGTVALRGQIHQSQDGQFLATTVEAHSADGTPAELRGELSLMVLDAASEAPSQPLARWDYSAEEIAQANAASEYATAIQFDLPLSEPLPAERPLQLWVRLVNAEGRKWLNSAELDPAKSFEFASTETANSRSDKLPVARIEALPKAQIATQVSLNDGGWTVDVPGHQPEVESRPAVWQTSAQKAPAIASRPEPPRSDSSPGREVIQASFLEWAPER